MVAGSAFAQIASDTARTGDPWEVWPELDLFMKASPTVRFYFVAADAKGKESEFQTLDLAGYVDLTVGPHLPHSRQKEDWQTKKYVWARIGCDHIFKAEEKTRDTRRTVASSRCTRGTIFQARSSSRGGGGRTFAGSKAATRRGTAYERR